MTGAGGIAGAAGLPAHARIVVVGAGIAGIGAAIRLRAAGYDDVVVLERAEAVGGTWRDNTYPGCACDIRSHLYRRLERLSLSFYDKKQVGAIMSRMTEDTSRIWGFLVDGLPYVATLAPPPALVTTAV